MEGLPGEVYGSVNPNPKTMYLKSPVYTSQVLLFTLEKSKIYTYTV